MGAVVFALVAFAASFLYQPTASARIEAPLVTSVAIVAIAVLGASVVSRAPTAIGTTFASAGALVAGLTHDQSPLLAGALLAVGVFGERLLRVKALPSRAIATGLASVAGASVLALTTSFAGSTVGVRAAAAGVGAVLALLPFLVPAEDRDACALEASAKVATGDLRATLLRAADLRRESVRTGTAETTRTKPAWTALLRLVRARERLQGAAIDSAIEARVVRVLDERITAHVALLGRAHAAARAAEAAEIGLDDAALTEMKTEEIALSARGEAFVEVQEHPTA